MVSDTAFQPFLLPTNPLENREDAHESTGDSPVQKEQRLPAVLGKRDLIVFAVMIILFISNTDSVQFGGPAAFVYWAIGLFTFLVPCAFVVQWLGRRFPGEGAHYLWATRILGPQWGFFCAFCAWLPGIFAVVLAMQAGITFIQYLAPTWFTTPSQQSIVIVLVLVLAAGITCMPLRWLKYFLLILAALYLLVFALLGAVGIEWLESGHTAAVLLNSPGSWQLSGGNFAVYGVVILGLLGVDAPLFMGGEIRGGRAGTRRATSYVWWGAALSFLAYIAGTFGIMVIVPPGQAGTLSANVAAIQIAFGSVAGTIVAITLVVTQFAMIVANLLLYSRLLVVVARNHRLPAPLAKMNRHGVPVQSILVQAAIVAIVILLSFVVVPGIFETVVRPEDLANEIYNVLIATATIVMVFSTIQLFILVLWQLYRKKYRRHIPVRQQVLLVSMSLIGSAASFVGIWATVSSSWLPTLIPNERWSILVLGVTLLSLAIGWMSTELPRMYALLSEQRRVNDREIALREKLQASYNEQEILVLQQQELLAEVDRLYREQARAAVTDAITSLPNHRAVMGRVEEEVSRCQRTQGSFAVLFVDLDHFKHVNDTWGHRAGDMILREIASRLSSNLRMEDFVGRYGGEEFAVVLTDADLSGASQTAERLRTAVSAQPCYWEIEESQSVVPIPITASIGVAIYSIHGNTREELIERADAAMYQAKHTGRNRVCIAAAQISSIQQMQSLLQEEPPPSEVVTVQALTAVASAHDRGTDTHAHRLVFLAQETGRLLGRPEEELHLLRLAALLHDIGKIGIPDAILHKPGPLTDQEWTVMRRHPEISRQILEQAGGVFGLLANIVASHHERWDGKGYPYGLAGNAIPLCARILAVVDSYDAMTSRRPYREPMSAAHARAELQRCAGSQFDPEVVKVFLQVLDEERDTEVVSNLHRDQEPVNL